MTMPQLNVDPKADPRSIVRAGAARFTILTSQLIRLEFDDRRGFEDRASMVVINRRLPPPAFSTRSHDGWLIIETEAFRLRYREDSGAFDAANLLIELDVNGKKVRWRPGDSASGNLRGTTRTLDTIDGRCELEPGLVSRDGWALVDDSARCLFTHDEPPWATPRDNPGAVDWYFFGHGREYARAVHDFTLIGGRIPLPPRFVFGSWWSRYWPYSDAEFSDLVDQFRQHDVPLDVLVVDMDWHLPGWTGYTWDAKHFPDYRGFLRWCREQGLNVTLNLHPAEGVADHEVQFDAFCRGMGLDPTAVKRIPFDCADPRYMHLYFELLHHPYEREGVDFWWLDWQQERITKIPGLDPLRWLNHLHWTDMERSPHRAGKRPMIFSRWGGLGNHRYQIGFSGDTHSTWKSLEFQPEFTATASNVGYAYWSHDIGGHFPGPVDGEMYVRWIQLGALSPVLRTHTTQHADAERRIWSFDDEIFHAARQAFHLRQRLIPYIYTMARKCYDSAMPLCRPLYWHWPELREAYAHPSHYMFGDDLLTAPVHAPRDAATKLANAEVWLPPGTWVNWYTGEILQGPRLIAMHVPLTEIPLFTRAGAIIPLHRDTQPLSRMPNPAIVLRCFPGEAGTTLVYDDDGESNGYQLGECAWTSVNQRRASGWFQVTISAAQGRFEGMKEDRDVEVHVHAVAKPGAVACNGRTIPQASPWSDHDPPVWSYDAATNTLEVRLSVSRNEAMRIESRS